MSSWQKICRIEDIPVLGSRVVKRAGGDIAIFRNDQDEIFAIHDTCPHKGGPLSHGIVFGRTVACPLHSWQIDLATGEALAPDHGCAGRFELKVEHGEVYLAL